MNLEQLRYFEAIAHYGSYSSAARHLGVSQQALSHYVADLNQTVGRPMFRKNGRCLTPTEEGEKYLSTAQNILNIMAQTNASISRIIGHDTQTLRLGVTGVTGVNELNKHLFRFLSIFPDIQLDMFGGDSSQLVEDVRSGALDFAIGHLYGEPEPDLDIRHISRLEFVIAMSAMHERAAGCDPLPFNELPELDLEDLRDEVFIFPHHRQAQVRFQEKLFEQVTYSPTIAIRAANTTMLLSLIERGLGIGFAPYQPGNENLRYFRLKDQTSTEESVICRRGHEFTAAERFLIYLMTIEARKDHPDTLIRSDFLDAIEEEFREV